MKNRLRPRAQAVLFMALVGIFGAFVGAGIDRALVRTTNTGQEMDPNTETARPSGTGHPAARRTGGSPGTYPGPLGPRYLDQLEEMIGISKDQRAEIEQIIEEDQARIRDLMYEYQPRFRTIAHETRTRINEVLDDEQRERIRELRATTRRGWPSGTRSQPRPKEEHE